MENEQPKPRIISFNKTSLNKLLYSLELRHDPIDSAIMVLKDQGIVITVSIENKRKIKEFAQRNFQMLPVSFFDATLLARVWLKSIEDLFGNEHNFRLAFPDMDLYVR